MKDESSARIQRGRRAVRQGADRTNLQLQLHNDSLRWSRIKNSTSTRLYSNEMKAVALVESGGNWLRRQGRRRQLRACVHVALFVLIVHCCHYGHVVRRCSPTLEGIPRQVDRPHQDPPCRRLRLSLFFPLLPRDTPTHRPSDPPTHQPGSQASGLQPAVSKSDESTRS
ncbi:unnamed protein product [Protopolystoma xenopodis]|uniref:Uncharacterized protein n=1 Tax=Protopolystoma xenopodis TaxID=117903 RepID=A0A448XFD3_9PLAT|nr:unnamed protein product [Protopolystoma xenopodis]